ncbi:MAG: hypothetical protein R6U04_00225 [Bacteroidales bacterium]
MRAIFIQILLIYLAGISGLYKAVPLGFAIGASPYITAVFAALGSLTAVFVLFFSGTALKAWILRIYGKKKIAKTKSRFTRIMDRYGVIGLGLFATGLIGPILTVILGILFVKESKRLMIFLCIGIILWSVALTLVGALSMDILIRFL